MPASTAKMVGGRRVVSKGKPKPKPAVVQQQQQQQQPPPHPPPQPAVPVQTDATDARAQLDLPISDLAHIRDMEKEFGTLTPREAVRIAAEIARTVNPKNREPVLDDVDDDELDQEWCLIKCSVSSFYSKGYLTTMDKLAIVRFYLQCRQQARTTIGAFPTFEMRERAEQAIRDLVEATSLKTVLNAPQLPAPAAPAAPAPEAPAAATQYPDLTKPMDYVGTRGMIKGCGFFTFKFRPELCISLLINVMEKDKKLCEYPIGKTFNYVCIIKRFFDDNEILTWSRLGYPEFENLTKEFVSPENQKAYLRLVKDCVRNAVKTRAACCARLCEEIYFFHALEKSGWSCDDFKQTYFKLCRRSFKAAKQANTEEFEWKIRAAGDCFNAHRDALDLLFEYTVDLWTPQAMALQLGMDAINQYNTDKPDDDKVEPMFNSDAVDHVYQSFSALTRHKDTAFFSYLEDLHTAITKVEATGRNS